MTYQVLARRLRPQRFADVVGQDHVTRTLQAAIAAGRVAHAFLFTGPRGVGKTTTARLLAKALNCEQGPTPEPRKVLATVVSRCQRYDLRRIGLGELRAHLRRTVDAERLALSDEALALVAREAEGSLRDAQSLLEQVLTVAGSAADDAAVRQVLGAADRRLVVAVADAVLAGDPGACVRHLAELYAHGYDAQRFCRDLLEHFRHLAVLAATGERALVAELPEAEVAALAAQAARRSADDLQRFFRLLLEADEALAT